MANIDLGQMNDNSLEILADLWDPYLRLMSDEKFTALYMANIQEAIKYACKNHKPEVAEIAAVLEGEKEAFDKGEYVINPFKLPIILLSAIGSYAKINKDLFISQAQSKEEASSGSAMVNTEAKEQPEDS